MKTDYVLDSIYFTGPFGATGSALHSAVPVVLLLVLYRVLGLRRRDTRGIILWFLVGWLGHAVVDFLTHVDDARPLFWPLSDWLFSSPVSYYDSDHYGRQFSLISNGLALATIVVLGIKRLRKRGESLPEQRPGDSA